MKKLIIFILLLTCCPLKESIAQKLTATASKTSVSVGEPFQVTFSLNASGTDVRIAHINDFDILQGPYNSSSMSIVNGVVTQSFSLTYVLSAKKEGKYTLGPATVNVNGTNIQSNIITIDANKSTGNTANNSKQGNNPTQNDVRSSGDNLFLNTSTNKTKVYLGEQFTLIHKLYYRVDILQYNISKMPEMDGCFVQDGTPAKPVSEVIDGKNYMGGELKRTYVIPQRTGKITIEPMEGEFVVRQQSSRRPRDIFEQLMGGGYEDAKYTLKSKPLNIEVIPLPETGKPEGFSGAVGHFSFKATLSKDKVKANEAINLTITISGKGNIKLIDPLKINFPEDFEIYDPKITQNITTDDGVGGTKTFDYTIIPRHEGDYKIDHLSFSYFDPNKKEYVVLPSSEFLIHVEKGDPNSATANVFTPQNKEDVKVLGNDIRYIKTNKPKFTSIDNHFFGSTLFYLLLLIPLGLFFGFIFLRKKNSEINSNPIAVKERKATKMAKKRLITAERDLAAGNKEKFYNEVSQALYGYVSDKFNISVANLTKDTITDNLRTKGVSEDAISKLVTTIDNCEYARYAPNAISGSLKDIYNDTIELLTKLEHEIKS